MIKRATETANKIIFEIKRKAYAGDLVILSQNEQEIKDTTFKFIATAGKIDLKINEEKSK